MNLNHKKEVNLEKKLQGKEGKQIQVKGDDSYFAMLFQRLCSGRQLVLLK
jgi:hypothetical protein